MQNEYPEYKIEYHTVFEQASGISYLTWQLIRKLYLLGGSGGIITKLYNTFRQKSSSPNPIILKILSSGLDINCESRPSWIARRNEGRDEDSSAIFLIEHPLVARILANRGVPVFYIHGEIAAPDECVIPGITKCFVPLELTKERMVNCGAASESILVTGLLIEPELAKAAENNFSLRVARLNSNQPLTVAFFISQAYPKPHIDQIAAAVESVLGKGMKAIVFTGTEPNKMRQFRLIGTSRIDPPSRRPDSGKSLLHGFQDIQVITSKNRQEENQKTAELMSKIDVMVAASHERTNWAFGLGLPMFVLFPLIGTYAKQNFDFAFNQGVAYPLNTIENAKNLGDTLIQMRRENTLAKMVKRGFSVYSLSGARFITEHLVKLS